MCINKTISYEEAQINEAKSKYRIKDVRFVRHQDIYNLSTLSDPIKFLLCVYNKPENTDFEREIILDDILWTLNTITHRQ